MNELVLCFLKILQNSIVAILLFCCAVLMPVFA